MALKNLVIVDIETENRIDSYPIEPPPTPDIGDYVYTEIDGESVAFWVRGIEYNYPDAEAIAICERQESKDRL